MNHGDKAAHTLLQLHDSIARQTFAGADIHFVRGGLPLLPLGHTDELGALHLELQNVTELLLPLALGPFDLARLEPRLRLGERICQLAEENLEL